jgi:hypothetical protein
VNESDQGLLPLMSSSRLAQVLLMLLTLSGLNPSALFSMIALMLVRPSWMALRVA